MSKIHLEQKVRKMLMVKTICLYFVNTWGKLGRGKICFLNGDFLQQYLSGEVVEGDSSSKVISRECQNCDVGGYSGRKTDTGLKVSFRSRNCEGRHTLMETVIYQALLMIMLIKQTISHESKTSEENVKTVKQSFVSESPEGKTSFWGALQHRCVSRNGEHSCPSPNGQFLYPPLTLLHVHWRTSVPTPSLTISFLSP